jgi:hypothetical protein
MVHMDGAQFKRMLVAQGQQDVQKNDRIESARQAQRQARARGNVADQRGCHVRDDRIIWQELP